MKKNDAKQPNDINLTLSDSLADHPIVSWISENGRMLLWILAGILIAAFFLYRLLGFSSSQTETDFLRADKEFILFQNSVNLKDESKQQTSALDNLTKLLAKHPELQAKYDGLIAQDLIMLGNIKDAQFFANRNLERISNENLPFFIDYAKTTLITSNQNYEEALKQALNLKQQILDNPSLDTSSNVLYTFNLIRIAILSQQIGDRGRELAAWQEVQKAKRETFSAINSVFREGKISLQDYIQTRMKTLK